MAEVLLKGGTVIDGTGAPRRQADVLVADGKIKALGSKLSTRGQTVDVTGLAVTPGIIDPHTHLDGQLMFEPTGSSSNWHGVTTVLMGHCGYSLAPIRPEHRDYIIKMFARVEEVPPEIFEKNLPWDWVTFPEYIRSLDKGLGLNAVAQVGHSTLRYYVMGDESIKRKATDDEVAKMKAALRESIQAGAFGFTTSRAPSHVAWNGEPVPSRWAAPSEFVALAEELRANKFGTLGLNPMGLFTGMTAEDKEIITQMTLRSGKPMQLNGASNQDAYKFMLESTQKGMTIYGVTAAQPFYRYFSFQDGTNAFHSMDTWWKIMNSPVEERRASLASKDLRPRLRAEVDAEPTMDGTKMRRPRLLWSEIRPTKTVRQENKQYEGMSIKEIAAKQGKHVADAILDLMLSEDMKTQFIYRTAPEQAWLSNERAENFKHPCVYPMNSDSGAHLANECKTGEGTYFLRHWVMDRGIMSLEEGVRKVTSQAAQWIGLPDRGVIKEGKTADIAVFDLATLDVVPKEQAWDLPGGAMRWIQRASGVRHVMVNGQLTICDGKPTGALPGKVIRSTDYNK